MNALERRDDLPIGETARAAAASGYFGVDPAQAIVKLLWAEELKIGRITALAEIAVIKGKPVMSAHLIASRIKSSDRYDFRSRELTSEVCRLEFFERGDSLGIYEFSIEDARRAGLVRQGPWQQYPKAMLFARAISAGYRVHCPDVFAGGKVYVEGELDAPEPIVATVTSSQAAPLPALTVQQEPIVKLASEMLEVEPVDPERPGGPNYEPDPVLDAPAPAPRRRRRRAAV